MTKEITKNTISSQKTQLSIPVSMIVSIMDQEILDFFGQVYSNSATESKFKEEVLKEIKKREVVDILPSLKEGDSHQDA